MPIIKTWVLNGPSVESTNEDCWECVKVYYKRIKVKPENNSFYFTFEPHSLTVLEFFKKI